MWFDLRHSPDLLSKAPCPMGAHELPNLKTASRIRFSLCVPGPGNVNLELSIFFCPRRLRFLECIQPSTLQLCSQANAEHCNDDSTYRAWRRQEVDLAADGKQNTFKGAARGRAGKLLVRCFASKVCLVARIWLYFSKLLSDQSWQKEYGNLEYLAASPGLGIYRDLTGSRRGQKGCVADKSLPWLTGGKLQLLG